MRVRDPCCLWGGTQRQLAEKRAHESRGDALWYEGTGQNVLPARLPAIHLLGGVAERALPTVPSCL